MMARQQMQTIGTALLALVAVALVTWAITTLVRNKKEGIVNRPLTYGIQVVNSRGVRSTHTVTIRDGDHAYAIIWTSQQTKIFTPIVYARLVAARYALSNMVPRNILLNDSDPFYDSTKYDMMKWANDKLMMPPSGIVSYKIVTFPAI